MLSSGFVSEKKAATFFEKISSLKEIAKAGDLGGRGCCKTPSSSKAEPRILKYSQNFRKNKKFQS